MEQKFVTRGTLDQLKDNMIKWLVGFLKSLMTKKQKPDSNIFIHKESGEKCYIDNDGIVSFVRVDEKGNFDIVRGYPNGTFERV